MRVEGGDESHRVRIVLADDHSLVRAGFRALLNGIDGFEVVAEASNGDELLNHVAALAPDVVLTDIAMPGLDGIAASARIGHEFPITRVIVLSMHEEAEIIRRAVGSGAHGYLLKSATRAELELTVRAVVAAGSHFSAAVLQLLDRHAAGDLGDELTPGNWRS